MMKKLLLVVPFLVLTYSSLYAGEVSTNPEKKVEHRVQKRTITAEELQARIDKFNNYLSNLPIEIQQTIGELNEFKARGAQATKMVKNLLVTLDNCANKELDPMSEEMCETLSETSVGSLIRDKKKDIESSIASVSSRLKELKKKEGNTALIQNGIRSLEHARDILRNKI